MAVTDSRPFAFMYFRILFFFKKGEILYCDFVLLLLLHFLLDK